MLTLTEATEQTGKSKSTLTRAIKSGKLSAQRNEHGDYRVEPSELFRVFEPTVSHDEPKPALEQGAVVTDLLEMVKTKDSENAELRDELEEAKERLDEHREAARALISPADFEARLAEAMNIEKAEQAKEKQVWKTALAEQKQHELQQAEKWQQSIADRQQEIQQARNEADEIRQREKEHLDALKAERDRVSTLESRGLIARLFNKKIEPVG